MRVGSLFSGIGGLDLGLERAGMQVVWQSEIDPYCSRVLAKHWPDVPNLGDVTSVDWRSVEPVDLICGGFPCQPFSTAGKRRGAADHRWLWPEVERCLRVLRPRFALLENVPGLFASPEFGTVLGDLAELGFDAEWECIPAASVGAPHLRYRVFIVAHAARVGGSDGPGLARGAPLVGTVAGTDGRSEHGDPPPGSPGLRVPATGGAGDVADTASRGRHERSHGNDPGAGELPLATRGSGGVVADTDGVGRGEERLTRGTQAPDAGAGGGGEPLADADCPAGHTTRTAGETIFRYSPIERSGRRGGSLGDHWAAEPDVGRVAYGIPSRVDRLRGLGNAVVPQVAEWIGLQLLNHLEAG